MSKQSCMLRLVCVAGLASWMPAAMAQTLPPFRPKPIAAAKADVEFVRRGKPNLGGLSWEARNNLGPSSQLFLL